MVPHGNLPSKYPLYSFCQAGVYYTETMEVRASLTPEPSGGWRATVTDSDCEAYAKRLDKLKLAIAEQIHHNTGTELCDIVVRLDGIFPDALSRYDEAKRQLEEAEKLRREASAALRQTVAELRSEGLTMRDIGALLGVSAQRVSQLCPDTAD